MYENKSSEPWDTSEFGGWGDDEESVESVARREYQTLFHKSYKMRIDLIIYSGSTIPIKSLARQN